jgi:amino-acid N-acetyltransferase
VTDASTLNVVKQCAGSVRFELESALSRGRTGDAFVQTTGGNFFSAQPVGVRDGVSAMHSYTSVAHCTTYTIMIIRVCSCMALLV